MQLHECTAATFSQLIWTNFDFVISSGQFPPLSSPSSSPDKHNNSGVGVWRGNRRASERQQEKASALAASHYDRSLCQILRLCTCAAVAFLKPEQQQSCRPQHRYYTVSCKVKGRTAANQQHPVETQHSLLLICIL